MSFNVSGFNTNELNAGGTVQTTADSGQSDGSASGAGEINTFDFNGGALNDGSTAQTVEANSGTLNESVLNENTLGGGSQTTESTETIQPTVVEAEFASDYRILVDVEREFVSTYTLGFPVQAEFVTVWRNSVSVEFESTYGIAGPVSAEFVQQYTLDPLSPVSAEFVSRYTSTVAAEFALSYGIAGPVLAEFSSSYGLLSTVEEEFVQLAELLELTPVSQEFTSVFVMPGDNQFNITGSPEINFNGRKIPIASGTIARSEDNVNWNGSVLLASLEDFALFRQDDEIIVDLFGEQYTMMVDSKELNRSAPVNQRATLFLVSPAARLDFPRSEPFSFSDTADIDMQTLIEDALGEPVDWQLLAWTIDGSKVGAESTSPLSFAKELIQKAGGRLESKRDGTLRARYHYPVSVKNYDTATVDHIFSEQQDIHSVTESFFPEEIVNRIRILDAEDSFSDRIEFVADEDNPRTGELLVYPAPFRTSVVLDHTSPAGDIILNAASPREVTREENGEGEGELVEFINSEASLGFPIDSLVSLEWVSESLGGITFEPNQPAIRSTDPTKGYGLALIKYKVRYLSYRVESTDGDSAQFILEETANG